MALCLKLFVTASNERSLPFLPHGFAGALATSAGAAGAGDVPRARASEALRLSCSFR